MRTKVVQHVESEKVFQVLNNIPGSQLLSDVRTLYSDNIFFQGLFEDFRWLHHFWRVVPLRCAAQCQEPLLPAGQWPSGHGARKPMKTDKLLELQVQLPIASVDMSAPR